jgi:hypothetical protein
MKVTSFQSDILPLFTERDIQAMSNADRAAPNCAVPFRVIGAEPDQTAVTFHCDLRSFADHSFGRAAVSLQCEMSV